MAEKISINPDAVADHLQRQEEADSPWYALFQHFFTLKKGTKVPIKWLRQSQELLDGIGPQDFFYHLPGLLHTILASEDWFKGNKAQAVKGMLHTLNLLDESLSNVAIARITEKAYTKKTGRGPLSKALGNLGITLLRQREHKEAYLELIRLQSRTEYPSFLKALRPALEELSALCGLSQEEAQDQIVPDYGLESRGLTYSIGDYQGQIYLESYAKITTEWLKPDGKAQKSVPAILKREQAPKLQAFKALSADIRKTLQGQRNRLERSWQLGRSWSLANWETYIRRHPLMQVLADNLIWIFAHEGSETSGILQEGELRDAEGKKLPVSPQASVRLWHPVSVSSSEVLAWRDYLFAQELRQCFKQAFREIYVLTDAEKHTDTYSNRFSAHILNASKLWALSQQRGWNDRRASGQMPGDYPSPAIYWESWGLAARLDVAPASEDYLSTQKFRFVQMENEQESSIPLDQVDPVLFSEAMRDVDLFVAISSIGSDPNWQGGSEYSEYWMDFSFGEKSQTASAKQRKEVLQRLLPHMPLGQKTYLEGNYLYVEGQIRRYKINLGSGNILMLPHDEYLCIVPKREESLGTKSVFLPFDQDSTLSIILSKAHLLVKDDEIRDSVIVNQIKRDL